MSAAQSKEHAHRRSKVLIAEDDQATREALCELLCERYEVLCVRDGIEAIEKARTWSPDLMLLDVFMPGADGLTAHQTLLRDSRTPPPPVIFLSGSTGELATRCLERDGTDYIRKPVNALELVARVERALRESEVRKAMQELAHTDELTGLANYRALAGRTEHEYQRALRYHYPISVATIDLDHLKQLNDQHGHEVGNRAIVELARCLRLNLRESDFAARFGGDEFVVLLPHQTPGEAAIFGERLRVGLEEVSIAAPGDAPIHLSISVGIAGHWKCDPKDGSSELIHASDAALYEAKRRGRNQVIVYEADLSRPDDALHQHA